MTATPHDAWAHVYDHVQRESFGDGLDNLSAATTALVERLAPAPGPVLDLGAGSGRLAIPLALRGYRVTAVEPSVEMLGELRARAADEGLVLATQHAGAQSFAPVPGTALALAVFTVMSYLLDEADIRELARRVAASLAPGGSFVFDLADPVLFADCDYDTPLMRRQVRMTPVAGSPGRFAYRERCEGTCDGAPFAYREALQLRCWQPSEVLDLMATAGLVLVEDHSAELLGTASRYLRVGRAS